MPVYLAACDCGLCSIKLSRMPTQRMLCHCTICQQVYDRPFADVMMTDASTVKVPDDHSIGFKKYKKGAALDRGSCVECHRPIVGFFQLLPGVRLAFVPSYAFGESCEKVDPGMHIYYGSRLEDIDDTLPKFQGAMRSQIACLGPFIKAYRGK